MDTLLKWLFVALFAGWLLACVLASVFIVVQFVKGIT